MNIEGGGDTEAGTQGDAIASSLPALCKPHHPTSWVWPYFSKYTNNYKPSHVVCLECWRKAKEMNINASYDGCEVNYGISHSSSKLTTHMKHNHSKIYFEKCNITEDVYTKPTPKKKKENGDGANHNSSNKRLKTRLENYAFVAQSYSSSAPTTYLAAHIEWVVKTCQSLDTCEDPAYRQMMSVLNPENPNLNRHQVLTGVKNLAADTKDSHKQTLLKGAHVALANYRWASAANENFSTTTGHFIDNKWDMHSITLGCCPEIDVYNDIRKGIHAYDISNDNIASVTTGTEVAMVDKGRIFAEKIKSPWVGCVDHILDQTAKLAFDLDSTGEVMTAARRLVNHFTGSFQAGRKLLTAQTDATPVPVLKDVASKWWSTMLLIQRLLHLQPVFERMANSGQFDVGVMLTTTQWQTLSRIEKVISPFSTAQEILESEKTVTISLVPFIIHKVRCSLEALTQDAFDEDTAVRDQATLLMYDFISRWGTAFPGTCFDEHTHEGPERRPIGFPLHTMMAAALDPRTKTLTTFNVTDRQSIIGAIRDKMFPIATDLCTGIIPDAGTIRQPTTVAGLLLDECIDDIFNLNDFEVGRSDATPPTILVAALAKQRIDTEMALFFLEPSLELYACDQVTGTRVMTNPLEWWRDKQTKYPILSTLAKRILCTPATSECVFTGEGQSLANKRAQFTGDNADVLAFVYDNIIVR